MAVCMTPTAVPPSRLLASTGELMLRVRGSGHDGRLIRIRSPKCTIGSASGCTLRLRAPGVFPLQCWILRGAAGAVIRRLHGPATLNGAALEESPLTAGDRLRLGSVELEVVECSAPAAGGGSSPFPPPHAAAETAELETRLTVATERIARLEAESRQGFQSSIVAADRADQLRDALAAAHQQLAEACRELAAAQETMMRQTVELDGYRRQLNDIEAEEGELAEQLIKARHAADVAVSERAAREAAAAEAQARLTTQTQRWETEAAEAEGRLTTQTQRWDAERVQLERRLQQREAELEAVRSTSTAQTGAMTIAIGEAEAVANPALQQAETRCADLARQLAEQSGELETLRRLVGEHTIIEGRLEHLQQEFDQKCRELAAAEERISTAIEQARKQDELEARARTLAQQEADLVERVARVTESKQQLVRERDELTAERERFATEQADAERKQLAITQANAESAGQRETQLEQQTIELEKHIEAANARLAELDALRNQLTGERAALDERAHRMAQRQRELETKEADIQQQWTQIETRRDEANERAADLDARRQELEQQAAAFLQRRQELERQAAGLAPRQQLVDEREQQIAEQTAALEERQRQLEELVANLSSQGRPQEYPSDMASQTVSSPIAIDHTTPTNVTACWQPIASPSVSTNAGAEFAADLQPVPTTNPPDANMTAAENSQDSDDVDVVLSRLVRSGLWRSDQAAGDAPAVEPPAAPPAVVVVEPVLNVPAAAAELPAAALPRTPSPEKSAEGGGDDESIESYMDRLLKRVRGSSPASTAPPASMSTAVPATPLAQVATVVPPELTAEEPTEYMPRTTAPELPANLSAMRELANTAARTAIDRHVRKHTGRQAAGRLVAAGLTIATSVLLGYWAWQSHSLQAGVGAGIGGGIGIYWTLAALRRLFGAMRLNRPHEAASPSAVGE